MKPSRYCLLFFLTVCAMLVCVFKAEAYNDAQTTFSGKLLDGMDKAVRNGMVIAAKEGTEYKTATNKMGFFDLQLPTTGPFDVTYSADGFIPLTEKGITIENGKQIEKHLQKDSVGGWWVVLLALPGLFGLFVAYISEWRRIKNPTGSLTHHRLVVSLFNGLIWAGVLAYFWCCYAEPEGVTKVRLFHHNLTFEFYVPMLGLFGALLYVFDLLRSGSEDEFKSKEFGMRIIMAPYVAIVMVALFGKDLQFVDISSHTGQGTLAFFSGLLVIVVLQGLIERANEFLGRWRRNVGYQPSAIAKKFKLSEAEDLLLRKIAIRHPGQLIERDVSQLKEDVRKVGFDEYMIDVMIRETEQEKLYSDIGKIVWKRLERLEVKNLQEYANLADEPIRQLASDDDPALSDERLLALRNKAQFLYTINHQKSR